MISDPIKRRLAHRNFLRKRREEFFRGKVCVKCGSDISLEIDHIDPSTKISHRIWGWSKVRMEQELSKCQVLCSPCHWEKTIQDRGLNKHGSERMLKSGCHCSECNRKRRILNKYERDRRRKLMNSKNRPDKPNGL